MKKQRENGAESKIRRIDLWLLFIAPAVLAAATVAANLLRFDSGVYTAWLEVVAPYLAATGMAIYAVRAIVTRNPLFLMLTVLATAMLLREIDWTHMGMIFWTHLGIYTAFVVVAAWMVLWRKKITEPLKNYRYTSLLIAAVWTFFFSQLVARRVFKAEAWRLAIIPNEDEIHLFLEEAVETAGHILWIAGAVVGSWRRGNRREKPVETTE